ncbi:MAG: type VI secretion system baseplate subunit TssF [Methylomonas sp.]|nr:MAG: type VI secretion system baseplate subunit TssF [Methylomonas sp.]
MDELLPYYEQELGFLKRYSREFAERYPKIAGRLLMRGEVCEDPHIERMIQAFALMNARTAKRLDDDYPEFTEALFEVLYPHYLKPFPSCSIVKFDFGAALNQLTVPTKIERGTTLTTRPVKGVNCRFKTVFDVVVAPVRIAEVTFDAMIAVPEYISVPAKVTSMISIKFELTAEQATFEQLNLTAIRLFIDGETSFCARLKDTLFLNSLAALVETPLSKQWLPLTKLPITAAGFDEADALIPFASRAHPAYRLLTEFFGFPEKFNFFDLDLAAVIKKIPGNCREFTLNLLLGGIRADSNQARILADLTAKNILLSCTPVINLFKQKGDPIRVTHTTAHYPVVADARNAYAYEVYSIDSVKLVRQTAQGEFITAFRPFYSLRHSEQTDSAGHYWAIRRNENVAITSPGYETEIAIVDIDFNPAEAEAQTLSLELTCTNRDLPALLSYGLPGGDLYLQGGSVVNAIHFLRKPSESYRFERGKAMQWRLISQLTLNHLTLVKGGLEAFQEILRLYDIRHSPASQRIISGMTGLESRATSAWLAGNPFACLVRGIEIRLTLDEEHFVGSGINSFARVMEHFLGLYVNANSFTQLVLVSKKTGEEIVRCAPRSGDQSLA